MSPRLRNLLFLVGFVGAGFAIYLPLSSTTKANAIDAGILADCQPRLATCPTKDGLEYDTKSFRVERCLNPDGGRMEFILRKIPRGVELLDLNACTLTANCLDPTLCPANAGEEADGGTLMVRVPAACACVPKARDAGVCLRNDGGDWRPWNNEIQPGLWNGAGCILKTCGEMSGAKNWPAACLDP